MCVITDEIERMKKESGASSVMIGAYGDNYYTVALMHDGGSNVGSNSFISIENAYKKALIDFKNKEV